MDDDNLGFESKNLNNMTNDIDTLYINELRSKVGEATKERLKIQNNVKLLKSRLTILSGEEEKVNF